MNRTIGGLPLIYWIGALGAGVIGFLYFRKKAAAGSSGASPATKAATGTPNFSQQQEVQDFQIFSALTSQQQGSDLNFLQTVAGLFSGGSSTAPTSPPPSTTPPPVTPAPPNTGTPPPATAAAPKTPGYGIVQTAAGPMVWLGVNQAGSPIYNVGGGEPVYFGNASALATGAQYEQPGYDIYTPLADAGLVSQNTSVLNQPYVG